MTRAAAGQVTRRTGRPGHRPSGEVVAIGVVGAAGAGLLALPLAALLVRTPWARMTTLLAGTGVGQALALSLVTATAATACSLLLGVPLAWLVARARGPLRTVLRALVTLPLVLPPVVGGVGLLVAFGRTGLLGGFLARLGLALPFTTAAVVLAQVFVAMPFLVVTLEGALTSRDVELEEAAATMGAGPGQVLRHVTLPLAAPSLAAGAVLCWARALGEFGATITFAGNLPGTTQTMPLAVYLAMQSDPDAALALSVVLLGVCAAVLVVLRGHWTGALRHP